MSRWREVLGVLGVGVGVCVACVASACKRTTASASDAGGANAASEIGDAALVDAAPALLAARCKADGDGVTLAESPDLDALEIGEATTTASGYALGVLRKKSGETVGSVALATRDAKSATFVDLGPPYADAPPPRPIARGASTFAFFFARAAADDAGAKAPKKLGPGGKPLAETRDLGVYKIDGDKATPTAIVAQQKDESLAFDAAAGTAADAPMLLAWDEDAVGLLRGEIKVAAIGADGKPLAPPITASPPTSDAELPRLAPRKGGYWLVWVARRVEAPDAGIDPGHEVETPAEKRTYRWLETVSLDERGAVVSNVRRLTSAVGHVSIFDLAGRPGGEALDVVARDDEQSVDGAGGRVVRITALADAAEPPIAIVSEAVGRGVPDLLANGSGSATAPSAWLVYADTADHVRLLPLDAHRSPLAAPSAEDALDKSKPLLANGDALLVAFPADPKHQLRLARCAP